MSVSFQAPDGPEGPAAELLAPGAVRQAFFSPGLWRHFSSRYFLLSAFRIFRVALSY